MAEVVGAAVLLAHLPPAEPGLVPQAPDPAEVVMHDLAQQPLAAHLEQADAACPLHHWQQGVEQQAAAGHALPAPPLLEQLAYCHWQLLALAKPAQQ